MRRLLARNRQDQEASIPTVAEDSESTISGFASASFQAVWKPPVRDIPKFRMSTGFLPEQTAPSGAMGS